LVKRNVLLDGLYSGYDADARDAEEYLMLIYSCWLTILVV